MTVDAGETQRGGWEGRVLIHLYRQTVAQLHLRPVGVTSTGHSSTRAETERHFGEVDPQALRAMLDETGVEIVELRNLADAVILVVRAPVPAAFLKYDSSRILASLGGFANSAVYFAVEDEAGTASTPWRSAAAQPSGRRRSS